MFTVFELDVPPPGPGLKTVTLAVPGEAMSLAGMKAVNCVALMKVVERFEPFQRTTEPGMKPVPLTVKLEPPSGTKSGLTLLE